jgi:hypothetical protein
VTPFVTAGAGFLLAVLWFDLMFDVQMLGARGREPDASVTSIAAYYRRVTTTARPMNRLIAAVMLGTLVAIVVQLARGDTPRWVAGASLTLAGAAMLVAALHTVPTAVRLGARSDTLDTQRGMARSILRDHVLCFMGVAGVLFLQLTFAR